MNQIDERFLTHRLRSTSYAGLITCWVALGFFAWRFYIDHRWSWDLLTIALTFVVVKWILMFWYRARH
jgi:hypothetical protein